MDPKHEKKNVTILFAEDDDADFQLSVRAFHKLQLNNDVIRLRDGQELVDYLQNPANHVASGQKTTHLILLDLNMPRKDGREATREIKADPRFKHIPIIIMTTSKAEEDVVRSYELGVNAYIRKPIRQEEFMEIVAALKRFWLEIVELPLK
jgi:CheY-like chemotaxis protein